MRLGQNLAPWAALLAIAANTRAGERLRIGINDVPPLSWWDARGHPAGFAVEILDEAARREGIELVWQALGDSPSTEEALRRGTLDATPAGMDTPERRREFYVSAPWWISDLSVLAPAASGILDASQLAGKRIATSSPALFPTLQHQFPGASLAALFPAEAALDGLCRSQAEAVALNVMDLNRVLLRRPAACRGLDLRAVTTGVESDLCIVASRTAQPLASRLRQRIDELIRDGTLAAIAVRTPGIPARSAVLLTESLRAGYERRVWFVAFVSTLLLLGVSGWSIQRLRNNVAARTLAQRKLERSEDRLARAHRIAALGDWEIDAATGRADWSASAREIACVPAAGEQRWEEFLNPVAPEDRERVRAAFLQTLETGTALTTDYWLVRPDGSRRFVRQHGEAMPDEAGRPARIVGAVQDLTEYKRLEEQFRQAQKLESLGQLAGGVAHDFNNLLVVINGYSDMVLDKLLPWDPLHSYVEEIRKAGARSAGLTQQLLTFGRRQAVSLAPLDLNLVVRDAGKMLHRLIGENVEMVTELDPSLRQVKADTGQIQQLLINLAVNARDAMPGGGRITIATASVDVDERSAREAGAVPGRYARLTVSDTGCGMDESTRARIFEPFFTTKPAGSGAGLGLSTVYGIVKQTCGWIAVDSAPRSGTRFAVFLPLAEEEVAAAPPASAAVAAPGGRETILVVEDQAEVRALIVDILRRYGYRVLEADNGQHAVATLHAHRGALDLLLSDVVMPGLSGPELAVRVHRQRPGVAVLLISGYAENVQELAGTNTPYLAKPFTPEGLARKVREVLDQARVGGGAAG